MAVSETIGDRIARARRERKISNAAIAKAAGVHVNTVSKWIAGQEPGGEALVAIASALGVSERWLTHGDDDLEGKFSAKEQLEKDEIARLASRARKLLRPRPYERVFGYLEQMREAKMPEDTIDEAERYLVESNFGVINKRDYRERSDDEVVGDIDMMWAALKIRFERDYGIKL